MADRDTSGRKARLIPSISLTIGSSGPVLEAHDGQVRRRWRIPQIVIPFLPLPLLTTLVGLVFALAVHEIVVHSRHAKAEAATHWTPIMTMMAGADPASGPVDRTLPRSIGRATSQTQSRAHS